MKFRHRPSTSARHFIDNGLNLNSFLLQVKDKTNYNEKQIAFSPPWKPLPLRQDFNSSGSAR